MRVNQHGLKQVNRWASNEEQLLIQRKLHNLGTQAQHKQLPNTTVCSLEWPKHEVMRRRDDRHA
jgi:hypothetical protein